MASNPTTANDRPAEATASPVSRRGFIAGIVASSALAACSGSDGASPATAADDSADGSVAPSPDGSTSGVVSDEPPAATGSYTIVQRFPSDVQVAGPLRLPISLSTGAAQFIQDGPETLGAQIVDIDGNLVGERITASKRTVAPAPYYDFRPTVDTPGFYALVVEGGPEGGASFQAKEPGTVGVPSRGELLPGFATPTVGNEFGVAALCTRTPEPCAFHDQTLAEALSLGRPVAYYVGTPAFCSTGSCAPALESLIDASERFDQFVFIHTEVFTDDAGTKIAPAVNALGLSYEPALFLTDAEGVIQERLDAVWDQTELDEALARVVA